MRTLILFFLFITTLSGNAQNPTFEWVTQMGGTGEDFGLSITTDVSGNVYTTGHFENIVDFDPGTGVYNLTSNGAWDIFVQKIDDSGNLLWVKQMGGPDYDYGCSITIDASGNVYTTGWFGGTVDFDPGTGINNLISNGGADIFIQKLDASGNLLWVKQMGGNGADYAPSITTDTLGNVYTTGGFQGIVDFNPGTGVYNLTSNGSWDIFIQKLDASGSLLWVKQMGGTDGGYGRSITTDASENVYITGYFKDAVDFDPGVGVNSLTSNGSWDIFIQKLDDSGNLLWVKQMGGTDDDRSYSITKDTSGNVYTTGCFFGTIDFDPGIGVNNLTSNGSWDIFIQKLDDSGNLLWVKQMGGTDFDSGQSITTDASGNVYTTGSFEDTVDFDPGTGINNLTSNGGADIFIQKLDASGNLLWVKQVGGTGEEGGSSLNIGPSGNVYTTGGFQDTVDFNPGSGANNLPSNGSWDIFIQKLNDSGSTGVIENNFRNEFLLYPNPTNGDFSIDLGKQHPSVNMKITDINGKIIMSNSYKNRQFLNLTLKEPSGVFLLEINSGAKIAVIKLVKE